MPAKRDTSEGGRVKGGESTTAVVVEVVGLLLQVNLMVLVVVVQEGFVQL